MALANIQMVYIIYISYISYVSMAYIYIVQYCRIRGVMHSEDVQNVLTVCMFSLISDVASIL